MSTETDCINLVSHLMVVVESKLGPHPTVSISDIGIVARPSIRSRANGRRKESFCVQRIVRQARHTNSAAANCIERTNTDNRCCSSCTIKNRSEAILLWNQTHNQNRDTIWRRIKFDLCSQSCAHSNRLPYRLHSDEWWETIGERLQINIDCLPYADYGVDERTMIVFLTVRNGIFIRFPSK